MDLMQNMGKYDREKDKIIVYKMPKESGSDEFITKDFNDEQIRAFNLMCNFYVLPLIRVDQKIKQARILFDRVNYLMTVRTSDQIDSGISTKPMRVWHLVYKKYFVPLDSEGKLFDVVDSVDVRETYGY